MTCRVVPTFVHTKHKICKSEDSCTRMDEIDAMHYHTANTKGWKWYGNGSGMVPPTTTTVLEKRGVTTFLVYPSFRGTVQLKVALPPTVL